MNRLDGATWLSRVRNPVRPLRVPARRPLVDAIVDEHAGAAASDPELYALLAIADGATREFQVRALFALLAASRREASPAAVAIADRVIATLTAVLPGDDVITVFLALRKRRANHKHTARTILRWVFRHPDAESLIARRRHAVRDTVEHALGRNVARACMKHVATRTPSGDTYLSRTLHRFVGADRERTMARLAALAARGDAATTALSPRASAASVVAEAPTADAGATCEVPKTVTATNRGDVAATLVHLYGGGDSPTLREGLDTYVARAAERLPFFDGTIALVVDASFSTLGYGERQYCCISQSWALRLVLERRCAKLAVYLVGGRADPPEPEGDTDLVGPLVTALAERPDVVAIVTDGYENRLGGELAAVIAALPRAGIDTPVFVVNSKFTHKDDLSLRTPAPAARSIDMWHERDFAVVLETLGTAIGGGRGRAFLTRSLGDRLALLERSRPSWTRHSPTFP